MWPKLLSFAICIIVQPKVFCNGYQPLLDDHGGTAALHISPTDLGSSSQRCGAILISDRHLLTAASCVNGKESERLSSISLGREDLNQNSSPGQDSYKIEDSIVYPGFGNGTQEYNDIAILMTDRKVQYSNKVWPYCLPEKNQKFTPFLPVQISGWGYVNETHKTSFLHVAYVKLMTIPRCVSEWRKHASEAYDNIIQSTYPQGLNDGILCAGRQGVDACIGDSGGPMTYQNKYGRHTLIGLIAKRTDCPDQPTTPGFYTNIAQYVDWIYATIGRSQQSLYNDCGGPPPPVTSAPPVTSDPHQKPGDVEVDKETNGSTAEESGIERGDTDGNQVEGDVVFAGDSGNTPVDVRSAHT